jgi:hypothetical protein
VPLNDKGIDGNASLDSRKGDPDSKKNDDGAKNNGASNVQITASEPDWFDKAFITRLTHNKNISDGVKAMVRESSDAMRKNFTFKKTEEDKLFVLSRSEEKKYKVTVPSNIEDLMTDAVIRLFLTVAFNIEDVSLSILDSPSNSKAKRNIEEVEYFAALINYLVRKTIPTNNWNFSGSKPHDRGVNTAKYLLWLTKNSDSNVEQYLPDCLFVKTATGRIPVLTTMINSLSGVKSVESEYPGLKKFIKDVLNYLIGTYTEDDINNLPEGPHISFSVIVNRNAKKKTKTVRKNGKSVKTTTVIKLKKPSTKNELFFKVEKDYCKEHLDTPWKDLARLANVYQNGIDINMIKAVEQEYNTLLKQQLENNSKLNGFLAERRKNLREIYGLKPTANVNIDEAKILEAFANVKNQKGEESLMRSLSSFYPHTISTKLMVEEASSFNFWSHRDLIEGNKLKFEKDCLPSEQSILTELSALSGGYINPNRAYFNSHVQEDENPPEPELG